MRLGDYEPISPYLDGTPLLSGDATQPWAFVPGRECVAGSAGAADLWALGITRAPTAPLVAEEARWTAVVRRITGEHTLQCGPLSIPWRERSDALLALRTGGALTVVPYRYGAHGGARAEADALLAGRAVASLTGRRTGRPAGPERTEEALRARDGGFRGARPPTKAIADKPSGAGLLLIHRERVAGNPFGELARRDAGAHCWPPAQSGQYPARPVITALQIRQALAGYAEPSPPVGRKAAQWGVAVFLA